MWNRSASDQATTNRIRDTLRRVLNLPPNTIMEYKTHTDSLKYGMVISPSKWLDKKQLLAFFLFLFLQNPGTIPVFGIPTSLFDKKKNLFYDSCVWNIKKRKEKYKFLKLLCWSYLFNQIVSHSTLNSNSTGTRRDWIRNDCCLNRLILFTGPNNSHNI